MCAHVCVFALYFMYCRNAHGPGVAIVHGGGDAWYMPSGTTIPVCGRHAPRSTAIIANTLLVDGVVAWRTMGLTMGQWTYKVEMKLVVSFCWLDWTNLCKAQHYSHGQPMTTPAWNVYASCCCLRLAKFAKARRHTPITLCSQVWCSHPLGRRWRSSGAPMTGEVETEGPFEWLAFFLA